MQTVCNKPCGRTNCPGQRPIEAKVLAHILKFKGRHLLAAWLKYFLSATIASSKPATLITLSQIHSLSSLWQEYGRECADELNINFKVLYSAGPAVCVLFYKKEVLESWINKRQNANLLASYGYQNLSLDESLKKLSLRFNNGCPDEVGIFLGIPAVEVMAFAMPNKPPVKNNGYWQVFVDLNSSLKKFKAYDNAFKKTGRSILQLSAMQ